MLRKILTSLLIFICAFSLSAEDMSNDKKQQFKESLSKMSYNDLEKNGVDYLLVNKFECSQACFEEMLRRETAKKNPRPTELAVIYYGLGRVCQDRKDFSIAVKHFGKALKYTKNQNIDKRFLADLYYFAGAAHSRNEQLEKALELEDKAIELAREIYGENSNKTASFLAGNANIYRKIGEYDKSIKQLKKAYSILIEIYGKDKEITRRVADKISKVEKESLIDK